MYKLNLDPNYTSVDVISVKIHIRPIYYFCQVRSSQSNYHACLYCRLSIVE